MKLTEEQRRSLSAAMDRYADGDNAAFGTIYDLLEPCLLGYFTRWVRNTSAAEDLTQQTFEHLIKARHNYVRGSDLLAWAFAIGRNILHDAHRKTKREVLRDMTEDYIREVSRDSNPDEVAATKQMIERVQHELEKLPETQRAAFDLVRQEGLSAAETAEVLGTSEVGVRLRVHRVYEVIRSVLKG
jgi:RNA polymerase sigma-70 factor (ECF subfamily)